MKELKDKSFIVFFGKYPDSVILSGPEKTAKRIFDLYARDNKTAFIQYFFDGSKHSIFKKLFGKESARLNDNAVLYTAGLFRILFIILKLKPGLIHIIAYERFAVISLFYKLFSNVKIIYNEHGIIAYEDSVIKSVPNLYRLTDKICEWLFLKFSDKIIFLSERSIDIARRYFKVNESKVLILSNGIDEDFHLIFSGRSLNNSNVLKAVTLNLSEYHDSGISFLKKVLEEIESPLELFVITGKSDFPVKNKNVKLYFINKMEPAVLADFYRDKDIFFSLNDYDTFSIASAEAMSAGLIPIVTNETGMSRFIFNGENGYSIPYNDTKCVNNILIDISGSTGVQESLQAKCAEIYDILSWDNIYESYKNIYERMN